MRPLKPVAIRVPLSWDVLVIPDFSGTTGLTVNFMIVVTSRRFSYLVPFESPVPVRAMWYWAMFEIPNSSSPALITGMYCCVPPMVCLRICNPPECSETALEIVAVICDTAPALVAPMPTVCADAEKARAVPAAAPRARLRYFMGNLPLFVVTAMCGAV